MGERFRCRVRVQQARNEWRSRRLLCQRLELALLARGVLPAAALVLDRFENAGLFRFVNRGSRVELGEIDGKAQAPGAFSIAQGRAEDRIARRFARPRVGHSEQVERHRSDQLMIAPDIGNALRRQRQRR